MLRAIEFWLQHIYQIDSIIASVWFFRWVSVRCAHCIGYSDPHSAPYKPPLFPWAQWAGTLGDAGHIIMSMGQNSKVAVWPRLLDVHLAAIYMSVGEGTIWDWIADGLLQPVQMPGTFLRDKNGRVIARPRSRKIVKILIDRSDLDRIER
jgi:hypothetical protein